jgi:hypothetical protein
VEGDIGFRDPVSEGCCYLGHCKTSFLIH